MSETQPAEPTIAAVNASTFVGSPCRAIAARTAQAHELILKVAAELSDEQLTRRPADVAPSVAPPVAWHLWHIARWADFVQASLNGMSPELERVLGPGRQIWDVEDLAERWELAAAAGYRNTGMGLDDEGSARLRLPERTFLLDYARRAFAKADRAVAAVDEDLFVTPCTDLYEQKTSIGTVVMSHLTHANRHLGMIEALKGMLGVRGTATL